MPDSIYSAGLSSLADTPYPTWISSGFVFRVWKYKDNDVEYIVFDAEDLKTKKLYRRITNEKY